MRNRTAWFGAAGVVLLLGVIAVSCGGTGGGGSHHDNPGAQFVLNSNAVGQLILNVNPTEVDANKSDRIGLVATLTDTAGRPFAGVAVVFWSDIPDITFVPGSTVANSRCLGNPIPNTVEGQNCGVATTDSHGNADIIAVAGATPSGTGGFIGTGAIFAAAQPIASPVVFGLLAQTQVTLNDIGFIDALTLGVIPSGIDLVEPAPGTPLFFNIIGGTPPYGLTNPVSGIGVATLSQHCTIGCTENGGALCIGSPCQSDPDCGAGSPDGTCIGAIKRCLASCAGSNCAGSRCDTNADCNDGSSTPANVCKDSSQALVYNILSGDVSGTHTFNIFDAAGNSVDVTVTVSFVCGNGVARGDEQCDLGDFRDQTCESLGFVGGGAILCSTGCTLDTSNCQVGASPSPGGTPGPTATSLTPTPTSTPGGGAATPTATGPTTTPTPGVGVASNLSLALLANCAGNNGNGTMTTVIAATVTDTLANPVPNGTSVTFSIAAPTGGAVINSPSATNTNPPCDVTNFQTDCSVTVLNQPGVAHSCITYPTGQSGSPRTVTGTSGAATDMQIISLP